MKKVFVFTAGIILLAAAGAAAEPLNDDDAFVKVRPEIEIGIIKMLYHTLQFGQGTDMFNYITQGGQEILFPYQRYSVDVIFADRHTLTFLYQPLTLETKTKVPASLAGGITIEDATFAAGSGLNLKYGFDFWRFSYLFSIIQGGGFDLGAGLSLQFRNASIVFESTDGTALTVNQNLGPVPILKIAASYRSPGGFFIGLEADGFYASSAIFNGAGFDFEGWIVDAALQTGFGINDFSDAFLTLRFLGGGAKGTASKDNPFWTESSSGYSDNTITALFIGLGVAVK